MNYYDQIIQSTNHIKERIGDQPDIALVLGSGLGLLADEIEDPVHISYDEIPNFPAATVKGHAGQLIYGRLHGKKVIAQSGRYHYYEGYTMKAYEVQMILDWVCAFQICLKLIVSDS